MAPGIGTEPGQSIKICFEWGGLTEEMKEQRMRAIEAQAEKDRTAGAAPPTTARSMRVGGSTTTDQFGRRGPKEYNFWVDVKLAQGQ